MKYAGLVDLDECSPETGFYLIDAADLNEAIRIASGIPLARVGSIEVRPVRALIVDWHPFRTHGGEA
jgi:hypothetical protein